MAFFAAVLCDVDAFLAVGAGGTPVGAGGVGSGDAACGGGTTGAIAWGGGGVAPAPPVTGVVGLSVGGAVVVVTLDVSGAVGAAVVSRLGLTAAQVALAHSLSGNAFW